MVEPGRLRDTLTIVAGRAETILYEGRPVRLSEMRGRAVMSNVTREPNVTPMLDVMLTLIVIFIFLAQQFILDKDVQIHDPSARGPGDPRVVALVAGPHETLWLDGHEISPQALAASVKDAPVEVSARPGASYQDVVHALDVARGAGARVLGLANKR